MFELPFGHMGMNVSIYLILFYGFGNLPDSQKISFGECCVGSEGYSDP